MDTHAKDAQHTWTHTCKRCSIRGSTPAYMQIQLEHMYTCTYVPDAAQEVLLLGMIS
jgi:hypothetical protein